MKILIVGTGAQGSVIATELAENGINIYEKMERRLATLSRFYECAFNLLKVID